jgi:hypothetical protein
VNWVSICLKLAPFALFLMAGIKSILEVFLPVLRDPDFGRWEVDTGGSYVQVLGWRKMTSPPWILAQGRMSNRTACAVSLIAGIVFSLIGIFGIRHVGGFPWFIPDLFARL